jgi:hypothetical protein
MARPLGSPKYGGRQKGTLNKDNADIKKMLLEALNHKGGTNYFIEQADLNPVAFMGLIGKLIPKDVNAAISGEVLHRISKIELIAPDVNGTDSTTT